MKSFNIVRSIYFLLLVLLLVFEFFSMQTLVLEEGSYYAQIVYLLVFALAVFLLVTNKRVSSNFFLKLFTFWMIYIILRFVTSTTGHDSMVAFFRYTWYCSCFIVAYIAGRQVENREKWLCIFMFILLLIAAFYVYQNLVVTIGFVDLESITRQTNIIFWSLCLIPFAFLLNNQTWQVAILSFETILVLITMKRSALVAMALILVLFVFSVFSKNNKLSKTKQWVSRVWIIVITVIVVSQFSQKFDSLFDNNMTRMEQIEDDQGSGRVVIWGHALEGLSNSNPLEFIFGHGVASTMETIRHTSCHNDFLTLLLEFGIVGAILYVLFIVKVIKRVLYTRKRDNQLFYSYSSLLILLLVIGGVGDLFTCYTYLGFMMIILAVLELRLETELFSSRISNKTMAQAV